MTKELKSLLNQDREFLVRGAKKRVRGIRHFVFSSNIPGDTITFPVCGDPSYAVVSLRDINRVTCSDCLEKLIELAHVDTYQEAFNLVDSYTITLEVPDFDKIDEKDENGNLTKTAENHRKSFQLLQDKYLDHPSKLPENVIGSNKEVFFYNLVYQDLIYGEGEQAGEPNQEKIAKLLERIKELKK